MSTLSPTYTICEKRRYKDQAEAEDMIRFLVSDERAFLNKLSTYKCHTCHNWHLTSRTSRGKNSLTQR